MGEAARRAAARAKMEAEGRLLGPSGICPVCAKDDRTRVAPLSATGMSDIATLYGICARCRVMWEAKPTGWTDDAALAARDPEGACDNCAFRKNSPESQNKDGWIALLEGLKAGAEFRCHKGCPIDNMIGAVTDTNSEGLGAEFNTVWMHGNKARTCAGFLRMIWMLEKKNPDYNWLSNRYPQHFKESAP